MNAKSIDYNEMNETDLYFPFLSQFQQMFFINFVTGGFVMAVNRQAPLINLSYLDWL